MPSPTATRGEDSGYRGEAGTLYAEAGADVQPARDGGTAQGQDGGTEPGALCVRL